MKVLFLGRNDQYSSNLLKFLKKKNLLVKKILIDKPIKLKIAPDAYDYVVCYRSYLILKKSFLSKIKFAAINFHPGPPSYRGIGCANFSILNQEKIYGVTAHIINEKIDNGSILDVKYFKVKKNITLSQLLTKSYKAQFIQAKRILDKIFDNPSIIKKMINKNKNILWSKKLYTRKELDNIYNIKYPIHKTKFDTLIRATNYKDFKPYITLHDKKFILK